MQQNPIPPPPPKRGTLFAATVYGVPMPQGSKTPYPYVKTFADGKPMFRRTPAGKLVPVLGVRLAEGSEKTREQFEAWREAIALVARVRRPGGEPFCGPVIASYKFYLPKPKSTQFDLAPAGKPDLDKLIRAVSDALTGIVFVDDSRIVRYRDTWKDWVDPREERGPRVEIAVEPV